MINLATLRIIASLSAVLFATPATFAASETDDPAVFAPKDALAFVGVADMDKFIADFAGTGIGRIFADRAAAVAFGEVKDAQAMYDDWRGRIARAIGVDPAQMKWPLGGSCAAFVYRMQGEAGGGELFLGYGVTLGVRDAATAREYYAKLTTNLKTIAVRSDSVTSGPDTIDFFMLSAPEFDELDDLEALLTEPTLADAASIAAKLSGWRSVALCLREDRLFAGDSAETVRAMLKRDQADSLASQKDYGEIDRILGKSAGLRILLNVPRGLAIAREMEPQGTKELETLLGASCLRSLIGVVEFGSEKFDARLEFVALMEGARAGLAKVLSMPNAKTAAIGDAPADALYVVEYRIDPAAAFRDLERAIAEVSQATDDLRMTVMTESGEVLHVRDDLINALRSPQRLVISAPPSNDPERARASLSIAHGDAKKLEKWLAYLREVAPLTDREAAGTTVYDLPFNASLAILKDRVVLGTSEAVDALAEPTSGNSLADSPEFRRAIEVAPAETSMVSFEDTGRLMRTCAAIGAEAGALPTLFLQKPAIGSVYYAATMGFTGAVGPGFKDKVEPWAALCGPQISTAATTPEGIRISTFLLKPARKSE
ncbi:MAG: hypothetical protein IT450_09795 [Phycisphaerales bacterium]|nr:hypothetical protein [Phycisphaerales bacterium]